ncbi:DMT family transporter [Donghicola tyrosinivorans]|uniref:Threonine/homoserine efflux transporter RhtA n=1 Tax=Donghicola tyrosinivorans TaxID=1652492 RepID=A0A2T0X0R5_9RHOB|nr:DMT family transporter [Donghicola tyrosinivorans]PRY92434.1 threonine/homoserine efflux transporter RhtA [Donghicola tyrosinivorans]
MRFFVLTAVVMVAFAANSVLNRMAVEGAGMSAMGFAAVRLTSGAVVLWALVGLRGGAMPWRQGPRVTGVLALLGYALCFSLAYEALDAGLGALLLFGMVQITMFLAAVLRREEVPLMRWIGAAVAFGGLVWLLSPGGSTVAMGPAVLMAGAGVAWGLYSLAGRHEREATAGTAANFVLAAPLAGLAWIINGGDVTARGAILACVSGAIASGLGYALWYQLVPRLGAARAAVAQLTVPVIAGLGGALLLAEVPSLRLMLAGALVLGGVALSLSAGSVQAGRR